jgi:hypothetical protein
VLRCNCNDRGGYKSSDCEPIPTVGRYPQLPETGRRCSARCRGRGTGPKRSIWGSPAGSIGQQKICGRCLRTLADGYCGFAGYPTTTNGAHSRGSASASDFAASVIASIALAECIALISRAEMKSCSSGPCRWRRFLVRLIPVALCALHAKHPFFPRGELFLNFLSPNARAPHRFHVNVTRRDFRSDLPT